MERYEAMSLHYFDTLIGMCRNILCNYDLYYIVEKNGWSIEEDGLNITSRLSHLKGGISSTDFGIKKNTIVHYGSLNLFLGKKIFPCKKRKIIATCFHIDDNNPRVKRICYVDQFIDRWHTSCNITKQKLISFGVKEEKITVIPLGIDLRRYEPASSSNKKNRLRELYGIPRDKFVIGSFQKDGNGWGLGMEPKLIKGPDILCDVLERLSQNNGIFVILSGPARGYVIDRLEKAGIDYKHFVYDSAMEVAQLYKMSDLCMVTSRVEGGPKAILESMASGVPIISTKVGMAPDIIRNGENGILIDGWDPDAISNAAEQLIHHPQMRKALIDEGIQTAKFYDLDIIADRYEKELYMQ